MLGLPALTGWGLQEQLLAGSQAEGGGGCQRPGAGGGGIHRGEGSGAEQVGGNRRESGVVTWPIPQTSWAPAWPGLWAEP